MQLGRLGSLICSVGVNVRECTVYVALWWTGSPTSVDPVAYEEWVAKITSTYHPLRERVNKTEPNWAIQSHSVWQHCLVLVMSHRRPHSYLLVMHLICDFRDSTCLKSTFVFRLGTGFICFHYVLWDDELKEHPIRSYCNFNCIHTTASAYLANANIVPSPKHLEILSV